MDMEILTEETKAILEVAANVYADVFELRKKMDTIEVGANEYFRVSRHIMEQTKLLITCLQKLGLTPADRQRVSAIGKNKNQKQNDFSKFS